MPYWITETLITTPAFLGVYVLLGLPWAMAALPRPDWRDRPLLLATSFALGSGLLSALMFALGSFDAPLLSRANVLIGLAALLLIGGGLALSKARRTSPADAPPRTPFTVAEWAILGMIGAALLVRWVVTAYWPFTAYDALWVYGYEGRLYFLEGLIPAKIGYYPQYLPLQYTFGQLIFGAVNDSAARAVLPLLHLGSILAAYSLGTKLFTRRVGVFLAGLWALYPAVGAWARMGDLEIPLTFLITLSAVFFFAAWFGERPRHYGLLAGAIYGLALWTKPTAGAFALGVILLNGIELARVRGNWAAFRPRFAASVWMALACAPLGGAWYLRNIALGHNAVDFPPRYWHTLAERGGGQLLWLVAALALLLVMIYTRRGGERPPAGRTFGGLALLLAGVMPSALARFLSIGPEAPILLLFPSLDGLPRLGWFEAALIVAGVGLVASALVPYARRVQPGQAAARVGWMLAVIIPYFIVYFWLYSYHVRLSFAITPLMALPIAVMLAGARWPRWLLTAGIVAAGVPGLVVPLYDKFLGWDTIWRGELLDDTAKLTSGNEALMWMVDGFNIYEREHGEPPIVAAPGVQRLPFFFPQGDMRIDEAPTRLSELDGVTYFVDSHPDGTGIYERAGIPDEQNQVLSALGRTDIMRRAWWKDDGIFRYEIYELNLENRFTPPQLQARPEQAIIFGDFARFVGHAISYNIFEIGQRRSVTLFWEVIGETEGDYMTYIHLRDADGTVQMAWDGPVGLTSDGRYYSTLVWEPGEYITDARLLRLTNEDAPPGEGYTLVVGLYDLTTGERVPVTADGEPAGDGYRLDEQIEVIPPQG